MDESQTELADRVRALLSDQPTVREVPMFGGRSFMVNDAMVVVSARKGGSLLVRVAPERHAELLTEDGASQPHMGKRSMARGWIEVSPDASRRAADLTRWVYLALEHNRS